MISSDQKKNLVVVHLESLSVVLFQKYISSLPFINSIYYQSVRYNNFISSATSTMMAMSSFFYGKDDAMDHFEGYHSKKEIKNQNQHLFYELKSNGYTCSRFVFPKWGDVDEKRVKDWGVWTPEIGLTSDYSSDSDFVESIRNAMNDSNPWALYIHPLISHVVFKSPEKNKAKNAEELYANGFRIFDSIIEQLYTHIEQIGKSENTLWLFYGDHGDCFLSHSFNGGFFHGTEPYAPMVHCPMFFCGNRKDVNNELVSTIDCKQIIKNQLGLSSKNAETHGVVFSQNFFMNQPFRTILNKAFVAFNGRYILMVSYLGLELYDCIFDPHNQNNLLSLFSINNKGELKKKPLIFEKATSHFKCLYNDSYIGEIVENFGMLHPQLYKWIEGKETNLGKMLKVKFPRGAFYKIRKRKFYWIYPVPLSVYLNETFKAISKRVKKIYSYK